MHWVDEKASYPSLYHIRNIPIGSDLLPDSKMRIKLC